MGRRELTERVRLLMIGESAMGRTRLDDPEARRRAAVREALNQMGREVERIWGEPESSKSGEPIGRA